MLLAVTSVIIAIKKIRRYLKNRLMKGSVFMYHEANSRIDQVTNSAIGVKVSEYWSKIKLKFTLKLTMLIR